MKDCHFGQGSIRCQQTQFRVPKDGALESRVIATILRACKCQGLCKCYTCTVFCFVFISHDNSRMKVLSSLLWRSWGQRPRELREAQTATSPSASRLHPTPCAARNTRSEGGQNCTHTGPQEDRVNAREAAVSTVHFTAGKTRSQPKSPWPLPHPRAPSLVRVHIT